MSWPSAAPRLAAECVALQALDDDDDSFEMFQKEASQLGSQVARWPTPPLFALLLLVCLHADNQEPFEGKGCMHLSLDGDSLLPLEQRQCCQVRSDAHRQKGLMAQRRLSCGQACTIAAACVCRVAAARTHP